MRYISTKFIKAYRKAGIGIFGVMPQNEFNSAQIFPSCCWTAQGLASFVGSYLGPEMKKLGVDVMFGTMERANYLLVDTILQDSDAKKYVKAVGFQWAGKDAVKDVRKHYPGDETDADRAGMWRRTEQLERYASFMGLAEALYG